MKMSTAERFSSILLSTMYDFSGAPDEDSNEDVFYEHEPSQAAHSEREWTRMSDQFFNVSAYMFAFSGQV